MNNKFREMTIKHKFREVTVKHKPGEVIIKHKSEEVTMKHRIVPGYKFENLLAICCRILIILSFLLTFL